MKKIGSMLLLLSLGFNAQANIGKARDLFNRGDKNNYPQIVDELIKEGMYFSAVPFVKEYLANASRVNNQAVDRIVDEVVTKVGVKQFETLPVSILENSNAATIRYILAKKYFGNGKFDQALSALKGKIPSTHPVKPYALLLEGSIYSVRNNLDQAKAVFQDCVVSANQQINSQKDKNRIRQLLITRDYCTVGIPRAEFASGNYASAHSSYLDLPKTSFIWPEILFEEAWNSFYLKDYNRTLGKLVSYKAPVFTYIFNPEVDVLKAMTYLEMCLYDDASKTVESFYDFYEKDYKTFETYIRTYQRDLQKYYTLVKSRDQEQIKRHKILSAALESIERDPAYIELYESFNSSKDEIEKLNALPNDYFKNTISNNLKDSLSVQRNLIGSYTRGQLIYYYQKISKSLQDMSYIKLEVLTNKKNQIYGMDSLEVSTDSRGRGNIANIKRNDKQYFWSFNGEFWADELGDYVFSLKSECR